MKHKHHIIPKHMGGDNSKMNLTPPISVELHAAFHKERIGNLMLEKLPGIKEKREFILKKLC